MFLTMYNIDDFIHSFTSVHQNESRQLFSSKGSHSKSSTGANMPTEFGYQTVEVIKKRY